MFYRFTQLKDLPDTPAGTVFRCSGISTLAKNVDSKRVAKHIPTVADAAKEGASKAIDFIRVHKKETIIISGVLFIGSTVAGTIGYE